MKRKLIIRILPFLVILFALPSCKKFLEKPISSDVTIKEVYASKEKTEQALWNVYSTASIYEFPYFWSGSDNSHNHYGGARWGLTAIATDESSQGIGDYAGGVFMNVGNWGPGIIQYIEFDSWYCYRGIRNANLFIENVDKSPFSESEKASMKAEAIFLRALMHFDLMQRLGGVPIVDHTLKVGSAEDIEGIKIPRSTFKETVDFIVSQCDEAAKYLPNNYPSQFRGRITKGAALALKSRTLLYAASPLFNAPDGQPYVPVADPKLREMVGYTTYDANRWQLAADASKAVLDWAVQESGGCVLYKGLPDYSDNYEQIFLAPYVPEIILDAGFGGLTTDNYLIRFMTPGKIIYGGSDPVNHGMTLNYTKFYQKKDGTDQVWDEQENVQYPYATYKEKLKALDPRFQATVFYSGEEWVKGSGTRYDFYASADKLLDQYNGVGLLRKFAKGLATSKPAPRWITFRLAEFYLNYAEALNEVNGSSAEIVNAVNEIRRRAGMPDIIYTDQADMRAKIHRERNVELAFEQHRFFDVRRWKIAGNEGIMKGGMWGLKLSNKSGTATVPPYYTLTKFQDRVWENKMYLYPFKQSEVDKGYITQNPGW